jgi:hypothetical protein
MRNTPDVTGGKPIAFLLQSISGVNAINPFTTSMEERERCNSFIWSQKPHETMNDKCMDVINKLINVHLCNKPLRNSRRVNAEYASAFILFEYLHF